MNLTQLVLTQNKLYLKLTQNRLQGLVCFWIHSGLYKK